MVYLVTLTYFKYISNFVTHIFTFITIVHFLAMVYSIFNTVVEFVTMVYYILNTVVEFVTMAFCINYSGGSGLQCGDSYLPVHREIPYCDVSNERQTF